MSTLPTVVRWQVGDRRRPDDPPRVFDAPDEAARAVEAIGATVRIMCIIAGHVTLGNGAAVAPVFAALQRHREARGRRILAIVSAMRDADTDFINAASVAERAGCTQQQAAVILGRMGYTMEQIGPVAT